MKKELISTILACNLLFSGGFLVDEPEAAKAISYGISSSQVIKAGANEDNPGEASEGTVKCTKLTAQKSTYTISKKGEGMQITFNLTTTPENSLTKEKVTAKVKSTKIAKVTNKVLSENALVVTVEGVKDGTTTLSVAVGEATAQVKIKVKITEGTCGKNLTWKRKGTLLTIKGTGKMKDYSYRGFFFGKRNITKIIISSGVTSIGNHAFEELSKLKSVKISTTVRTIGKDAFGGCDSLKSITIPKSIHKIGNGAFEDCDKLKTVKILNKNCKINGSRPFGYTYDVDMVKEKISWKLIPGIRIYGLKGSTAEKYAKKHKIPFVKLG